MNIETYEEAKKIFLHYNGSYFHMQREEYLEQYMKFNISKKEERTISKSLSFRSAPIPTVEELQGYENIQEGLASRIVAMAEKQQENRQKIELQESKSFQNCQEKLVNGAVIYRLLGQIIGGTVVLSALIGGIYLLSIGRDLAGYITMLGAIGGLAISVGLRNKDENRNKQEEEQ